MKTKLTVSIDQELIPRAKKYARQRGVSLSEVIENALWQISADAPEGSFSERWRGRFRPAERTDERYKKLAKKYL